MNNGELDDEDTDMEDEGEKEEVADENESDEDGGKTNQEIMVSVKCS